MNNGLQFSEETLIHNLIAQRNAVTDTTVYYVAVYKQSESGLLYNPRMLVIQDKNFNIFYTKYFKPVHQLSEIHKNGGKPVKQKLVIVNTNAEIQQDTITITFIKESIKKKWIFRFYSEKLALNWLVLYKDLQEKFIAKTIKSKSRETASNSQYASILSHNRYYQTLNPSDPQNSNENKLETQNSHKKGINQNMAEKQGFSQKQAKLVPQKSQKK